MANERLEDIQDIPMSKRLEKIGLKVGVVYESTATPEQAARVSAELRAYAYKLIKKAEEDQKWAQQVIYELRDRPNPPSKSYQPAYVN